MDLRSQTRERLVLTAAVGTAFMAGLDLFVVNVALDDVARQFDVGRAGAPTSADLSWVLSAYAVTFAALLIPFGQLADRFGNKNLFMLGLTVFTVASGACAAAGSLWVLVLLRVIQAAGAAAMTPTSLSILLTTLPPVARLGGVRLWSAVGAVAATLGPTVGGMLTQIGWQWVFLINLPIGGVLLLLAAWAVPKTSRNRAAAEPDLLGAALLASTVALASLALVKSPEWGWGDVRMLSVASGGLASAAAFALWSRRRAHPVISDGTTEISAVPLGMVAMILFNAAFSITLLVGILWLQQIWDYSARQTGYAVAAGPILVPVTAALAHRFLPTVAPTSLVSAGAMLCAAGNVIMAVGMDSHPSYVMSYLPGWLLVGVGVGLGTPNLMASVTHELPDHMAATGSAVATMARQIGYVVGVSILFAIVANRAGLSALDDYRHSLIVATVILLAASLVAAGSGQKRRVVTPAARRDAANFI